MLNELTAPATPEPPQLFGPSSVLMTRNDHGTQYRASVWIGGEGLGIDGRWGETVELSYFRKHNAKTDFEWSLMEMLGQYQHFLREKYELAGAAIVTLLLVSAAQGQTTSRHFTMDDFKRAATT